MKYDIQRPAQVWRKWVYLEVWKAGDGAVYFAIGSKRDWFKQRRTGFQFDGETMTICTYVPVGIYDTRLSRGNALFAAKTYHSGKYRVVKVDLRR